jgi:hypothetical protein
MAVRTRILALSFALLGVAAGNAFSQNRTDPGFVRPNPDRIVPGPEGGGSSCPPGVIIGALPFSDSGTSCGGTNSITTYSGAACTAVTSPYPGPETIYQMTLAAGNNVTISADLAGSPGDLALFLVGTCGNGATCVGHSQDAVGPGAGPEVIPATSYAPGTYFLYVDSYYANGSASCGTFALSVTGSLPVELESFEVL